MPATGTEIQSCSISIALFGASSGVPRFLKIGLPIMLCPTCETETLEEYSESADAGVIGYLCARSNSVASGSGCGKIVTVRQYRALRLKAAADAKAASDAQKIDSNSSAGSSEDDDEDDSDASDEEEDEESSEDDDAGTDSASPRPVAGIR